MELLLSTTPASGASVPTVVVLLAFSESGGACGTGSEAEALALSSSNTLASGKETAETCLNWESGFTLEPVAC